MIHSMSAASGSPMTAPTAVPLAMSVNHIFSVMRLKPKRCSMRKVPYHSSGRSSRPPMMANAASSASW